MIVARTKSPRVSHIGRRFWAADQKQLVSMIATDYRYCTAKGGAIRSDQASDLHAVRFSWSAVAFGVRDDSPVISDEGRRMKSLLLVFCISAMVAAEALPAAAQAATTCTQRLALCNSRCNSTQRPAVCRDKCKSNHATCMRTGTFPVIGPYGPWPGLEKR